MLGSFVVRLLIDLVSLRQLVGKYWRYFTLNIVTVHFCFCVVITIARILYTIPKGQNPEWTQSRMDTIPNGHNPEWTQSRMDAIPNGHNPEWTPSRKDTIPNGHNPEWTPSRMDTIPNGHNPE